MEPVTTVADPCPLTALSALPALPLYPRAAHTTLLLGAVPGGPGVPGLHDPQSGHSAMAEGWLLPPPDCMPGLLLSTSRALLGHFLKKPAAPASLPRVGL